MVKRVLLWTLACVALAVSCKNDEVIPLRDVKFATHDELIMVGDTMQLNVVLVPDDYNCNEPTATMVWTSSDERVASVSQSGLVEGLMAGTVTITFTWGDFVCSCEIDVDDEVDIPDEYFLALCLEKFDSNGDGILQNLEVCTVVGLDVTELTSKEASIDLKGIEKFTALQTLNLSFLSIASLDLSLNTSLRRIVCDNTDLTTLDLSELSLLEELDCHSCPSLSQLTLPQEDSHLVTLACFGCNLSELDLTTSSALEYLDCRNNHISALDLSQSPLITQLSCSGNGGVSITFPDDFDSSQLATYDND